MAQKEIELILLRQWASHMSLPIWVTGLDGDLHLLQRAGRGAAGRALRRSGRDAAGELTSDVPGRRGGRLAAAAGRVATGDGAAARADRITGACRYRGMDGQWRDVEVTAFPFEGEGRRPLGAVAIWWEVHEG